MRESSLAESDDVPTAPLLFLVRALRERMSGTVVAMAEDDSAEHVMLFHRGAVANVRLVGDDVSLEAILRTMSDVDLTALEECAEFASQSGLKLGGMLVARGVVTTAVLEEALRRQVQAKLSWLLERSPRMTFQLRPGLSVTPEYGGATAAVLEPLAMLLECARLPSSTEVVEAHCGELEGTPLVVRADPRLDRMSVEGDEAVVFRLLREKPQTIDTLQSRGLDARAIRNVFFAVSGAQLTASGEETPRSMTSPRSAPPPRTSAPPRTSTPPRASTPPRTSTRPASDVGPVSRPDVRRVRRSRDDIPAIRASDPGYDGPVSRPPMSSPPRASDPGREPPPNVPSDPPPSHPSHASIRTRTPAEWFERASHALRLLDMDGADKAIREALLLAPENPDYASTLAFIEGTWKAYPTGPKHAAAVDTLTKLITLHPSCELAYYYRARMYKLERKMREAFADFEMCLKLNPGNHHAADELRTRKPRRSGQSDPPPRSGRKP